MKYNLTFLQRLQLIPLFFFWVNADPAKRKSWHLVKKGLEKHEHRFTIEKHSLGYTYFECDHPGCNMCEIKSDLK